MQNVFNEFKELRPTTKLDKYIDLIIRGVANVDEFIYLKKRTKEDDMDPKIKDKTEMQDNVKDYDDPYDLVVVDYK